MKTALPARAPARVGKVFRLRPADMVTIVRALCWLVVVRSAIAVSGFDGCRRVVRLRKISDEGATALPEVMDRTRRALRVAQRVVGVRILHTTCIPRAVVVERTLASHGIPADLVIGVDTSQGFKAHAWVEVCGHVVGFGEVGSNVWKPIARFRSEKATKVREQR